MTGYFSRLLQQTGPLIAGERDAPPARPITGVSPDSGAEAAGPVIEERISRTMVAVERDADAVRSRQLPLEMAAPPTQRLEVAPEIEVAHQPLPAEQTEVLRSEQRVESPLSGDTVPGRRRDSRLPVEPPAGSMSEPDPVPTPVEMAEERRQSPEPPRPLPDASPEQPPGDAARREGVTLREVREWVAATPDPVWHEPRAPEAAPLAPRRREDDLSVREDQPLREYETVRDARRPLAAAADAWHKTTRASAGRDPVQELLLQIGSISITVEQPAPEASLAAVPPPRPAPTPAPIRETNLSRHYLRVRR